MLFRNIIRHLIVFALTFIFILPAVYLHNKSYYKSIERVNHYEQMEIVSLLKYAVENTPIETLKSKIGGYLKEIKYLHVTIKYKNEIVVDQSIKHYETNESLRKEDTFGDYTILIAPRIYAGTWEDYKVWVIEVSNG